LNGFKQTELGPIPVEWEVVRLGELIHSRRLMVRNGFPCGDHNQQGRGIPHLRPFNVTTEGQIELETIKYVETSKDVKLYLLKPGDIIFNNTNSEELVGKTAYWDRVGDFVLSNHMTILRVLDLEVLDPFYLSRFLHKQWYDGYYQSICRRHVNQASISLARLSDIPIPLPPSPEQRRIAHVLSTIQRATAAQDDLIAAAREVKRSLMRHLFTYGPVPLNQAEQVSLKETEIGLVPEHWEVLMLGDVTEKTRQTDPKSDPTWWFKYVDVSCVSNESLRIESFTEYEGTDAPSRARKLIKTNDIIFATVRPYLKRVAMVPANLNGQICSTAFCVIRCKPRVADPIYVFQVVTTDEFISRVSEHQRGSSYTAVTDKDVLNQPIPLAPLSEQQRIASTLSTVDRKIEAEEQRKAALQALFKTMLQQLMTGQVRVRELCGGAI
jgi:type I restriction enzyme S subunit